MKKHTSEQISSKRIPTVKSSPADSRGARNKVTNSKHASPTKKEYSTRRNTNGLMDGKEQARKELMLLADEHELSYEEYLSANKSGFLGDLSQS